MKLCTDESNLALLDDALKARGRAGHRMRVRHLESQPELNGRTGKLHHRYVGMDRCNSRAALLTLGAEAVNIDLGPRLSTALKSCARTNPAVTDAVQLDGEPQPMSLRRESVELLGMLDNFDAAEAERVSWVEDSEAARRPSVALDVGRAQADVSEAAEISTDDGVREALQQIAASSTGGVPRLHKFSDLTRR